jgi:tripartite-type tricarboxylate transporter receptor subunit TctC
MKRLVIVLAAFVIVSALLAATTQSGLSFTEGKTIRFFTVDSPGGGHDTEGRLITRRAGKFLPGEPKSIIKLNMPGAGGIIMVSHMYHRIKPDGLTWSIVGTTQMSSQVLANPRPNFDIGKMPMLSANSGAGATIVRDFLGVKKGTDLLRVDPSKIVVSGRTLTGASFLNDALGLELLGIKGFKYVVGYPGTAQMALAFFSGEISYVGGTGLHHALGKGGRYYSALQEGKAVLLWQTGVLTPEGEIVRSPGTDVPTFAEIYEQVHGKKPSGPMWEAYKLTGPVMRTLNRAVALSPGVPEVRVAALRGSFKKLYSTPAYIREWEKIFGLKLDFISGKDAQKTARRLLEPSPGWEFLRNEFIPKLRARK